MDVLAIEDIWIIFIVLRKQIDFEFLILIQFKSL